MDHYDKGCASNRQKRWWQSPTNKNIYNVPALSINSVTSYYLQGCVSDVSVSFLVDTGAGVSLLNGHVWDQAGLTIVKISPAPHSNLVGVDGHPLQVRGIVMIPLTISSTVFTQAFVIANNKTADGILRMDFLERNKYILDIVKWQITVAKPF